MDYRFAFLATLATSLSAMAPTFGAERDAAVVLEPTSAWSINYADDFCRLSRTFGSGEQQTALVFDRLSPGDSFRLMLIGNATNAARHGGEAKIRFGTGFAQQDLQFLSGTWNDKFPTWIFNGSVRIRPRSDAEEALIAKEIGRAGMADISWIAPISEADEASVAEVQVGRPLRKPLVLRTGSMKSAFAALRTCTDELLTHWGIDVARHKMRSQPARPVGSPGRWLNNNDYPSEMKERLQNGLVHFRLTVGEDGKPLGCHIQQSTNPEGFDNTVCRALMRRAEFEPARDKEGKPLVSYYINTVRFMIPE